MKKAFKVSSIVIAIIVAFAFTLSFLVSSVDRPQPFADQQSNRPTVVKDMGDPITGTTSKLTEVGTDLGEDIADGTLTDKFNETVDNIKNKVDEYKNKFSDNQPEVNPENTTINNDVRIGEAEDVDYNRAEQFGTWKKIAGSKCDTRNDILARDLENVVKDGDCVVTKGTLNPDLYSGKVVEHTKIKGTKSVVEIDHIVPLSYAYQHGASEWDQETRYAFANDPENLIAVYSKENNLKRDKGPSNWLPSNQSYKCEYSNDFLNVIKKYDLTIAQADYNTVSECF